MIDYQFKKKMVLPPPHTHKQEINKYDLLCLGIKRKLSA